MEAKNNLFSKMNEMVELNQTRDLTVEEQTNFDAMSEEYEKLKSEADREDAKIKNKQRLESIQADLYSNKRAPSMVLGNGSLAGQQESAKAKSDAEIYDLQREGVSLYLRGQLKPAEFERYNLRADVPLEGGALMMPVQMATELYGELRLASVLLGEVNMLPALARVGSWGQTTITKMGRPTRRLGEKGKAANDPGFKFGEREMTTHEQGLSIRLTTKIINNADMDLISYVNKEMGLSYGDENDYEILLGSGNKEPLGLLTASPDGIPSSRHFNTNHTSTTVMGLDAWLKLPDQIHEKFLPGCKYVMNRAIKTLIRLLKDSQNQYLWQPSVIAGQPDTFNGYPVLTTERAPSTVAANALVGLFGNLKEYNWLPCKQAEYLVNPYKYDREVEISSLIYSDGQPNRPEAFAICKMPAS